MLWSGARRRAPQHEVHLTIALTVAGLEAARRGHAQIRGEHLIFAALLHHERPGGPDLTRARDAVEHRLSTLESAGRPLDPSAVELSEQLLRALRSAARRAEAQMRIVTLDDVLDETRADSAAAALLDEVRSASERTPAPPESARVMGAPYRTTSSGENSEIVFWNDDVSTMEGVVEVLRECCGKGDAEALHVMLTTHYEGRAVAGRWPWHEAHAIANRAARHARRLGLPLRITVERVGEEPARPDGPLARVMRPLHALLARLDDALGAKSA